MKALIIEKADLKHNVQRIKNFINPNNNEKKVEIIAVIKGNGYGLGLVEYAKALVDQRNKFFCCSISRGSY